MLLVFGTHGLTPAAARHSCVPLCRKISATFPCPASTATRNGVFPASSSESFQSLRDKAPFSMKKVTT